MLNNKWGYINHAGQFVTRPQFDDAASFSEGLASVAIARKISPPEKEPTLVEQLLSPKPFESPNRYGFINKAGEIVVPTTYNYASDFSGGLAPVCTGDRQDGKCGYINAAGEVAIEFRFDGAGNFSEGLAPVRVGKKYGYIDKTGHYVSDKLNWHS
jgi:hypothetical protein